MKTKRNQRILMGILLIIWAGVIFYFSSQTGEESSKTSGGIVNAVIHLLIPGFEQFAMEKQNAILHTATLVVRKGAHFTEYLILGMLLYGFFTTFPRENRWKYKLGWVSGTLYAVSDEFHQYFSGERSPRLLDICIDSAGVCAGLLICFCFGWICYKWRRQKRI